MAKDYILTLKNITKEFPGVKALDDVTINVERGTIHGLVGENGAGKSTLIKVLAGIYQPNKGEVILEGKTQKFNTPIAARNAGPKERQCQRMLKLSHNCTHLTR